MITLTGHYNKDCKIFLNEVEEGVIELIQTLLNHPISEGVTVRIMPDTHVGKGIVIGFTMQMKTMVNPNHIGVDIGCSVTSFKLNKRFSTDELPDIDKKIRRAVPMGHNIRKGSHFDYWWVEDFLNMVTQNVNQFQCEWNQRFSDNKELITLDKESIRVLCEKIGVSDGTFYNSLGSLGGGNHFIEIGESVKEGAHYLSMHSGSRNFGLRVCNYHAKKMLVRDKLPQVYYEAFADITQNTLPKTDIPGQLEQLNEQYKPGQKLHLLQGDDMYNYLVDMVIAQTYAEYNHRAMAHSIFVGLRDVEAVEKIHSMHNFIDTRDWMIRKGAIRSYKGEKMIIPLNMRDGLLICEGKSNADWNNSAPHGAGRILARNKAFQTLDMDEFKSQMKGIYSTSVSKSTLDESPMAYKDKDMIMDAIKDTANILDTIKPILNIKAS